jgi:hypothetical protein
LIARRPSGYRLIAVLGLACLSLSDPARAEHESLPPDYPDSLERELASLQSRIATEGGKVDRLIAGAELYLNIADDLFEDEAQKRLAYEAAADMAKRALQMEERNAQAHFLYAAARGSAERLKGIANAGLVLGEIREHVSRAIELDPHPGPTPHQTGPIRRSARASRRRTSYRTSTLSLCLEAQIPAGSGTIAQGASRFLIDPSAVEDRYGRLAPASSMSACAECLAHKRPRGSCKMSKNPK